MYTEDESQETPKANDGITRRTSKPVPSLPFPNIFNHARHLLRLSTVTDLEKDHLVGRTQEVSKLCGFLTSRFPNLFDTASNTIEQSGSSLYISGPPGTGKTHMVHSILLNPNHSISQKLKKGGIQVHLINCIAMGGPMGMGVGSGTGGSLDEEMWKRIGMCVGCNSVQKKSNKKMSCREVVEEWILYNDECQPRFVFFFLPFASPRMLSFSSFFKQYHCSR